MNTTVSFINDKSIKRHEVMTGLSAGNIGAFVGQFSQGNDLTSDIEDKKLSVDQDYFHRTFDIQDGEKGNKDRRDEINEERIIAQKEREEDADNLGDAVEAVADELREEQEERMKESFKYIDGTYYIDGAEISEEAWEKTKKAIEDDPQGFGEKHDLNEEQVDIAYAYMAAMEAAKTPEEKAVIDAHYKQQHPEARAAVRDEGVENEIEVKKSREQNIQAGKTISTNEDLTATITEENSHTASHAIESGELSNEQVEIIQEVAQNKLEATQDDFDMFFDDDTDIAGSYSESVNPEGNTQSIASNFTNATNPIDSTTVDSARDFEKTKTFDVGNALT